MANESVYDKRKYGFPLIKPSENGTTTSIEYVDTTSNLNAALPAIGDVWGEYEGKVTSAYIEELENSLMSTMFVEVESEYQAPGDGLTSGTEQTTIYEVDWVMFQRSLFEHPVFEPLSARDIVDIEKWKTEANPEEKSAFRYTDETQDPPYVELSDLAAKFCRGIQLGQESYEDYSPLVRKTTTFVNGLPTESDAGLKSEPPAVPNLPGGYEWRKSADRSIQTGARNKWDRTEEWVGAIKVLSDKDTIYWT